MAQPQGAVEKAGLAALSRMWAERQPVPGNQTKQEERRRKEGRSAVRSGCWPASKNLPSELAALGPGIHNLRTSVISASSFPFQVMHHYLKLWLHYLCEILLLRILYITE